MTEPVQRGLFDLSPSSTASVDRIAGLVYVADFLPPAVQGQLLQQIDVLPWMTELKRRVQHYGYRYDYRSRSVDRSMRLGDLPEWASSVATLLEQSGLIARPPDQLIVNEYEPGQGIRHHVDCRPCFDDNVASLSLGSACVMTFRHPGTRQEVPLLVEPGSLVVMTGEARYDWMHGIPARKSDTFGGRIIERGRRVSLTLRKVILSEA
jgi:alkylated DNA repair dioxygenase AlkB